MAGPSVVPHALTRVPRAGDPPTDARLMQNGTQPANARPPLPGMAPVLVDVIFEAIERIREQDDTVLLMEQHALAALEIAD
jgi:hypothetical protein